MEDWARSLCKPWCIPGIGKNDLSPLAFKLLR
jgi:hypothetical protein